MKSVEKDIINKNIGYRFIITSIILVFVVIILVLVAISHKDGDNSLYVSMSEKDGSSTTLKFDFRNGSCYRYSSILKYKKVLIA